MKYRINRLRKPSLAVALRGRAWIEMRPTAPAVPLIRVALRGRAWIEIDMSVRELKDKIVALCGRAWIEIYNHRKLYRAPHGRPPREGVD